MQWWYLRSYRTTSGIRFDSNELRYRTGQLVTTMVGVEFLSVNTWRRNVRSSRTSGGDARTRIGVSLGTTLCSFTTA